MRSVAIDWMNQSRRDRGGMVLKTPQDPFFINNECADMLKGRMRTLPPVYSPRCWSFTFQALEDTSMVVSAAAVAVALSCNNGGGSICLQACLLVV